MKLSDEKLEKFGNGEMTLAEVMNVTPRQKAALLSLGYTFYSNGRLEDAARILEGLTTLDGSMSYAFALLGSIYQKKENYDSAIDRYTRTLMLDPDDTYCLANRGEILLRLGKLQEALTDLVKAMETDPNRKHPAANRARLLVGLAQDAVNAMSAVAGAQP
ncbi:tetratricopeptide repeat protein [bacterium]|nr:tetratricopeptide repeat protein [bacterium]